jgi:ferredoxin
MKNIHAKVRELFKDNKVSGYLGYKLVEGHTLPHLFTPERLEEIDQAVVAPGKARYPLDKLLHSLAVMYPEVSFAIQVRGCDERGLNELYKWGHIFQLVRAIHMAGRCIDCGLCEEACPADIPLRVLYKKANAVVKGLFDYDVGSPAAGLSPWKILGEEVTLETKPI